MENEYGHGLPREVIEAQRIQNGIVNATLDVLLHTPAGRLTMGDSMRSILKQAHECFEGAPHLDGAWYVLRIGYGLMLCPFGWNKWRPKCWCRLDHENGLWIFGVIP